MNKTLPKSWIHPNFTHTLIHDPQPHQETQHPTNLISPPHPLQTHPHLEVLSQPQIPQWDHQANFLRIKRSKFFRPNLQQRRLVKMPPIKILSMSHSDYQVCLELLLLSKELLEIALHVLTTKEEGLPLLPKAHQMCESMIILVKLAFTHIIFK